MKKTYQAIASTAIALTLAFSQTQAVTNSGNTQGAGIAEAIELYGKALPMKMDSLARTELLNQAESILKKVIEENPNSLEAHRKLMGVYLLKQDYSNGIRIMHHAITLSPEDPKLFISLAFLYEHSGALEYAEEMLDQAISLDPNQKTAKEYRTLIQSKMKSANMEQLHGGENPIDSDHGQLLPGSANTSH